MELEDYFKAPSQESIDKAWLQQLCWDGQMADEEVDEFVNAVHQWKEDQVAKALEAVSTKVAADEKIIFDVESSYITEDEDMEYPEQVVIFANFGEELGSRTIIHFDNTSEMSKFKELIAFMNNPIF